MQRAAVIPKSVKSIHGGLVLWNLLSQQIWSVCIMN
jgi:hypothetical protein